MTFDEDCEAMIWERKKMTAAVKSVFSSRNFERLFDDLNFTNRQPPLRYERQRKRIMGEVTLNTAPALLAMCRQVKNYHAVEDALD